MVPGARPLGMRRSALVLATSLLALPVAPFPQSPASASCAAPHLENAEGLVLERGATATIEGRAFVHGCRDSMSCGPGCSGCEYDDPPERPMEDVRLRLVQQGRSWDLDVADAGTADENHLGWVSWRFQVPAGVRPGRAKLVPDESEPVPVLIRWRTSRSEH